jgi:hypothetical protein
MRMKLVPWFEYLTNDLDDTQKFYPTNNYKYYENLPNILEKEIFIKRLKKKKKEVITFTVFPI